MLEVRVTGSADFHKVAARIRTEGSKDLSREMSSALRTATRPVQASIRKEYGGLPKRGGYAATFTKSLRFRASQRAGGNRAVYTLITFADGQGERRDIRALEGGKLRHPVYGRRRKGGRQNPWAVTSVKGDFHKRGTSNAADQAEREMIGVLEDLASRLVK